MSEWKPISSAPKDGTCIDVWVIHPDRNGGGYRQTDVVWKTHGIDNGWVSSFNRNHYVEGFFDVVTNIPIIRISHWMRLPDPPKP